MQFKHALVFAAAALCAVQAASFEHERNRRSASNIFDKATSFVSDWKDRIQKSAHDGISKIWTTAESIEDSVLTSASNFLKGVGANVDLKAINELVKGNIKSCASSNDIKSEALKIKDNLLSCVGNEVATIAEIVADISKIAADNSDAPAAIEQAITVCKGQAGEAFDFTRLSKCAASLKTIVDDKDMQAVPAAMAKNVQKAMSVVASVTANGASCLKSKLVSSGSSLVNLAKNVGACVKSGVTTGAGAETLAKAAPQLALFKFSSLLG